MIDISPSFGRRDPDARGYYGAYGGRFVPETLVAPIEALEREYFTARKDPSFAEELSRLLTHYVGRATPLWEARRHRHDRRLAARREDRERAAHHPRRRTDRGKRRRGNSRRPALRR